MNFKELASKRYSASNPHGLKQGIELDIMEYLYNFIKNNKLKYIIETGVCYGFSSLVFLEAIGKDGKLFSIEPDIKKKMVLKEKDYPNWTLINACSNPQLLLLFDKITSIDLFWHDSKHDYTTQIFEYLLAAKHCKYVGSHDINNSNAWNEFLKEVPHKLIIQKKKWGLVEIL